MKRRVVITGMGIWSCIGQDLETVTESLRLGRSGIVFEPERLEFGLQSGLVGNVPRPDLKPLLPRKFRATMSEDAEYAYMAARQAFEQAGITDEYLRENEVGIIWGSDGNSQQIDAWKIMQDEHDSLMIGPDILFKAENSSVSMNLSAIFHLKGINLCISAGCASASHSAGLAKMLIENGRQNIIIVGGSRETNCISFMPYDKFASCQNDTPKKASRPFDKNRDGAVSSGGAAAYILEDYEHAIKRGATIYAEIIGYGSASGGKGQLRFPDFKAGYNAITNAIKDANISIKDIDYVNSGVVGLRSGDYLSIEILDKLFGGENTFVGSTQSITGHEGMMSGASEVIYSTLMLINNFIAPNINIDVIEDDAKNLKITQKTIYVPLTNILNSSAGLGNTYCALVLKKI